MTALPGIAGLDAVQPVGSNGFVTTFRADDTQLGQEVLVDVMPPVAGNEVALQRFEQTLRALYTKPRHPAILPIHELGQLDDGRPYVITLGSAQASLSDWANKPRVDSAQVATLGAILADALAVAHERGVLHGDVRLDHVRLTELGEPVLGAFGYDRLARTLRTGRSDLVTSLTNASPEVLSGADPDAAADVWALSCCLHQLLLGRSPFGLPGDAPLPEILDRVLHHPLEDLRAAGVADDLATVLEAALQRDRTTRLSTATSLRRALRGVGRIYGQPRDAAATELPDDQKAPAAPLDLASDPVSVPFSGPQGTSSSSSYDLGGARPEAERARVGRHLLLLIATTVLLLVVLAISVRSLVT